jgi:LacI family transcriptional regulator
MSKIYRVRLLIETSREYGRALLRGICRYHSREGHWLIEQQAPFYVGGDRTAEPRLGKSASPVDGVIMRDRKGTLDLVKKGIPVVFVDCLHEKAPGTHRIVADDPAIARLAVTHLLERGLRHFAFVGYDTMLWSRWCRDSFVQAVNSAGCECIPFVQARIRRQRTWPQEHKTLAEWLCALPKPAGLLACNDDRARQVIDVCLAAGLNVPEEMAIVGVDNDEFVCHLSNPPISSVALGVEDAGYQAAWRLDQLMAGGRPKPQDIIPATLGVVARRSSEVVALQDPVVAQAVRFILANCRKPIQVADVLRQVSLSCRVLSGRFQRALGCGVHQYIKKARVAQIERLLLDTDCSIAEIADLLGFPSAEHIASYFRSVRGINPLALRSSRRGKSERI